MFQANLLVHFVDKLCAKKGVKLPGGAGNDTGHSKTRYERAADMFSKEAFKKEFGLSSKYHKAFKDLPKVSAMIVKELRPSSNNPIVHRTQKLYRARDRKGVCSASADRTLQEHP